MFIVWCRLDVGSTYEFEEAYDTRREKTQAANVELIGGRKADLRVLAEEREKRRRCQRSEKRGGDADLTLDGDVGGRGEKEEAAQERTEEELEERWKSNTQRRRGRV